MSPTPVHSKAYTLPELRQELQLVEGPHGEIEQSWIVYDPTRHRFFQISRLAFELLTRWRPASADEFVVQMKQELGEHVDIRHVDELVKFLMTSNLTLDPPGADARSFAKQANAAHRGVLSRMLHSYLFFKIPLLDPTRVLTATYPIAATLMTRTAASIIGAIGLLGLYLVSRQWDRFTATFVDLFSFEGALLFALSLAAVKTMHELGHAYAATRAGIRVNAMGIAFMVLTPVLYTDVTDAWRLRNRRDKIAIDSAGIVVELGLAAIALFLWAFLPDGPWRSAAFMIATTGLLMGLAINLNPLMRFDGYHILADAWRMPNLQDRSNALAVWWLRELLFNLERPPPEAVEARKMRLLVTYAFAVWIYRLLLFLGIALLVYHAFFKALGIVLFVVEIIWFILLPIWRELKEWWSMRKAIAFTRRSFQTAGVAVVGLGLLLVPWNGTLRVQGILTAESQARLFAPRSARIEQIALRDNQPVTAGTVAIALSAPDLEHEIAQARRQIALSRARLDRIAGDEADRANRVVLEVELERNTRKLQGLEAERDRLLIRIPVDGVARDVDRDLHIGSWIDDATTLGRVVTGGAPLVWAYVGENDVWRIAVGASVTFLPDDPLGSTRNGNVTEISAIGARNVDQPSLASVYGGAVTSDRTPDGQIKPRSGQHLVKVEVDGPPLKRTERGIVHIDGTPESIAVVLVRRLLQILVRESSA